MYLLRDMEFESDIEKVGILDGLRSRGFVTYFVCVALAVFILLMLIDLGLPVLYGRSPIGSVSDLVWDVCVNILGGLISAGFAWKYDGKPWINRPNTIKLDLEK